jgi:hypothetical protein
MNKLNVGTLITSNIPNLSFPREMLVWNDDMFINDVINDKVINTNVTFNLNKTVVAYAVGEKYPWIVKDIDNSESHYIGFQHAEDINE